MNIKQLREWSLSVERWPDSIRFDACSTTKSVKQTVYSHILYLESNSGKPRFEPYYNRLMQVYNMLVNDDANISGFLKQSKY